MSKYTIALAGNPNCGKTTLFNAFTGSTQRVGNWPGVTVERKEGNYQHAGKDITVVDLPGIYSFSAYSLDEKVSRQYILQDKPGVVVNIIDATNLERNLYLTTQLLEMKIPVVVALNMMDVARKKNIKIEIEHLAEHLGCPVVPLIAHKKDGLECLKAAIDEVLMSQQVSTTQVQYDSVIETVIRELQPQLTPLAAQHAVSDRWLAIKFLENEDIFIELEDSKILDFIATHREKIEKHIGDDIDISLADGRYGFIHGLARDVVVRSAELRKSFSDGLDKFVLNRLLGIPIFLAVMYFVFMLTIDFGGIFIDFFDIFAGTILVDAWGNLLFSIGLPAWAVTFLADGLGGGIQTVATFIPPIFFMFFSLSILEDSGYMSRAAFVMDRFMKLIGLPGKAFIPMLVGFGCNVPAIMATRTLDNHQDRLLTILINPFMSCGARLPIYVLFASVFFPLHGGRLIFGLYLTGIFLAIIMGLVFKKTIFKGSISSFVMELPPYHIPTFNGIMLHTWQKLKGFILRAGKAIVLVIIVLSILNSMGTDFSFGNENTDKSVLSSIGKFLTPVFKPMGIDEDNWPATVGLFTGIFAKEAVVGTLDALYHQEQVKDTQEFNFWQQISLSFASVSHNFHNRYFNDNKVDDNEEIVDMLILKDKFSSIYAAIAYLLFILIYAPCVAVIGIIIKETGWRWGIFAVSYLSFLAWTIATMFYQASLLPRGQGGGWLMACIGMLIMFYAGLRLASTKVNNPH